jgi:hypothetical protein
MTVDLLAGASSNKVSDWEAVYWPKVRCDVRRLQLRIAKAIRAGKHGKAKALSWLLTHSRSAKLLAVKQRYLSTGGRFGFFARKRTGTGESKVLRLHSLSRTVIERHIKVRGEANPYDPVYTEYFERRRCFAWRTLPCKRTGKLVLAGV